MEELILKHSLINAIEHDGKADMQAVLGKLIAEKPEVREKIGEIVPEIKKAVGEVNSLSLKEQKKKLERLKDNRDNACVEEALAGLRKASQTEENVMPHMLNAVKAYATLGEITRVLKEVFGEFKEPVGL